MSRNGSIDKWLTLCSSGPVCMFVRIMLSEYLDVLML